jgi:type II secretory pathway pseudopilin PulG
MKIEVQSPKSEIRNRKARSADPGSRFFIRHSSFVISESGFTLAEVLAAMLFLAVVIPVAMQGLQIASRAGVVSERKALGARLAESKLNELVVTRQWQSSAQKGTIYEGLQSYAWELLSEPWSEDGAMRLLTVQVTVPVQGQDYPVRVSTLVDASQ